MQVSPHALPFEQTLQHCDRGTQLAELVAEKSCSLPIVVTWLSRLQTPTASTATMDVALVAFPAPPSGRWANDPVKPSSKHAHTMARPQSVDFRMD